MMHLHRQLFSLLCLSLVLLLLSGHLGQQLAEARLQPQEKNFKPKTLFVFGDSYVDSGNTREDHPGSWKQPYGTTFPGKPTGRFSDGNVFSDYIAQYVGLKSPVPYRLRNSTQIQHLKNGMNFAHGGTGVFDTFIKYPNMTTQINFFNQLIKENVYTTSDLKNSIALVSVAGNDYDFYLARNGSIEGFRSYVASVVNQASSNMLRIQKLGVRKIVVDGLQPLGCLPGATISSSFKRCDNTFNDFSVYHNNLLNQAVTKLNRQTKNNSTFIILDLYNSFMSVFNQSSSNNIQDRFKPCCGGLTMHDFCGHVDEHNVKDYKLCDNPKSSFFWDFVHPTQAGWLAVYKKLQTTSCLHQIWN